MKIARIVSVVDTRTYEEVAPEKWRAVPGTGDPRDCDRCGREHEVHATVELADGTLATVGTGCAKGDSSGALRRGADRAKRRARLEHALAAAERRYRHAAETWAAVHAMTPPEPTVDGVKETANGPIEIWRMGDATVWTLPGQPFNAERRETLLRTWQHDQARALGASLPVAACAARLATLQTRLDRMNSRTS